MRSRAASCVAAILFGAVTFQGTAAGEIASSPEASQKAASSTASQPVLKVPDGFSTQLVAGPPLTERPITGAFDDDGRLYVAESSGSNDPVEKQLEGMPHRIVRLEDSDGDGKFDKRVVFADRMMFPEGTMFLDGSLYVSAPPSIWKLTDKDGDGVVDDRVEWFQGKTLTGCANDLHGPYVGPDGWIYWCKGAFAEQTHQVNGRKWKTRAAHIFRCRPDGTGFEPVMTGGMDNPVDIAFTPDGERILSATYYSGNPRVDGLAHAVYGGVYGKQHGVLDGHPRTGPLMPLLVSMSPAAPCGLERYDSSAFGDEYRDNYFLCQFNLRKVSRHALRPEGSTFASEDSDFVVSDNVDFHPTDVLVDADGSLLVIDTGGWYKLCCPTSQLWKPDVLGGIYRVRRIGAVPPADPRGRAIDLAALSAAELWQFLAHGDASVRQRASREFVTRRNSDEWRNFIDELLRRGILDEISKLPSGGNSDSSHSRRAAIARAWALSRLESDKSRALVRQLLGHSDESVQHAALSSVSLHRDVKATKSVLKILAQDSPANRRVAAEALGRIGDTAAVSHLLTAAASADDRIFQHSIIYALIELAEPVSTRAGLTSNEPRTRAAALVALDQMSGGEIAASDVIPLLDSKDDVLQEAARWLVSQHPDWGGELAIDFRAKLVSMSDRVGSRMNADEKALETSLVQFVSHPIVQQLLVDILSDPDTNSFTRQFILTVMVRAKLNDPPASWRTAIAEAINNRRHSRLALEAARSFNPAESPNDALNLALVSLASADKCGPEARTIAISLAGKNMSEISKRQFDAMLASLSMENTVRERSTATQAICIAPLNHEQFARLCESIAKVGPLEINQLLPAFASVTDDQLGLKLLESLRTSKSLQSLRIDILRESLAKYGPTVQRGIDELEASVNVDAAAQRRRIEDLLPHMKEGDVRRGHAVFHSAKATCSACHQMGHAGGRVGPDLSHIGEVRTERDLLESVLYPSLSFVRSYEPVLVVMTDGRTINGTVVDETEREYLLATGVDQQMRLQRDEVDQMEPSLVSIMPGGLDGQLSVQELADLVAFLKHATGK